MTFIIRFILKVGLLLIETLDSYFSDKYVTNIYNEFK